MAACCGLEVSQDCCAHHKGKHHAADWVDKQQLCSHAPHKEAEIAGMPDVPVQHGLLSAERAAPMQSSQGHNYISGTDLCTSKSA